MTAPPAPDPAPVDGAPLAYAAAPRSARWDRVGVWVAWGVIVVCVGLSFLAGLRADRARTQVLPDPTGPDPLKAVDPKQRDTPAAKPVDPERTTSGPLKMTARYLIGARQLAAGAGDPAELAEQIRKAAAGSPLDRLRAAPVLAELQGKSAGLAQLDQLHLAEGHPLYPDAESLRAIYTRGPDALDPAAREALLRRHGWFAELALSFEKPQDDPARRAVVAPARKLAVAMVGVLVGGLLLLLAGAALLVTGIVLLALGRMRLAYSRAATAPNYAYPPPASFPPPYYPQQVGYGYVPAYPPQAYWPQTGPVYPGYAQGGYGYGYAPLPPPAPPAATTETAPPDRLASPRTGPFLEAFAIYLASHIVVGVLVHFVFRSESLALNWVMLPVLPVLVLWPAWRGVKWSDARRGLGLHAGKGIFREIGAGVVGYIAGLPVFVVGVVITTLLMRAGDASPTHPLQFEIGKSWWTNVHLYLLACVWAPFTEETMFRGALFHHLRRRWNWFISAGLISLIFAAIHPQGWAAIPALGSLALVFAAVREWRGSLVAPMVGHFIQNFVATTMMILMMG